MNHYQVIDESQWKRAMHCMVFRGSVEPCFCVTMEMDVGVQMRWKSFDTDFSTER